MVPLKFTKKKLAQGKPQKLDKWLDRITLQQKVLIFLDEYIILIVTFNTQKTEMNILLPPNYQLQLCLFYYYLFILGTLLL